MGREVGRLFRLKSAGVAGRPLDECDLCIIGCVWSSSGIVSIAPEAAWWHDGDQFVEVEIDDHLQCFTGSALLKVFGQRLEPSRILACGATIRVRGERQSR